GEQVDDDRHVVRGLDSHAWVEVYFPETGWVRFDPTPSSPRQSAERARLAEARQNDEVGVDTNDTRRTTSENDSETPVSPTSQTGNETATTTNGTAATEADPSSPPPDLDNDDFGVSAEDAADGGGGLPELPSREVLALWVVAIVGAVAGARRTGVTVRLYNAVWLRYQRSRGDPNADVERAFARLEYLLGRTYRPRRQGETVRSYLAALELRGLDERAETVGRAYERARYGDGVSASDAENAIETVDAMVRDAASLLGRFGR
ncbi:MAG: DUF4129 domain-containing protein, partial [Halobacteriota archaeon]